ncbi:large ribosomal subunit protein mL49 [Amyelois transitella]|uniref:large ribosomal subunit protein mL49 n=1 Tax=Amyelois transitella TaxID=680683 RepID=UPI00067CDBA2|nr:large ribosomal subunit protein mL49 [Amyelois transitella]
MATVLRSQCAFARVFVGKTGRILNNSTDLGTKITQETQSVTFYPRKYSNYAHSPFVHKIKEQYEFEVVKKPPEWTYVERLLPFENIPQLKPKDKYPSGFVPQKEESINLPYFLPRNKYHDVPIYLQLSHRGQRKISEIRKIEGDIWLLNDEVKALLKTKHQKYIETRVHELTRTIEVKGDYVNDLKEWAYSKGL